MNSRLAFAAYNVLAIGTFLALLRLVTGAQYATTQEFMVKYWEEGFPPFNPLALVPRLATMHAGEMMAYRGGRSFRQHVNAAVLHRRRRGVGRSKNRALAVLVLAPLALRARWPRSAAIPTGGAAIAILWGAACLAAGLGAATMIGWLASAERGGGDPAP